MNLILPVSQSISKSLLVLPSLKANSILAGPRSGHALIELLVQSMNSNARYVEKFVLVSIKVKLMFLDT